MADSISYHNLVARGAIEGLKILAIDSTSVLGYIARSREKKTQIVNRLNELLQDKSFYVKNTACVALANALEGTNDSAAIQQLTKIVDEDTDSIVMGTANACINIIIRHVRGEERKNFGILEETRIDSKYKSKR